MSDLGGGNLLKKKIIFGVIPNAKPSKVRKGIKIAGGVPKGQIPIPQLAISEPASFDAVIERSARRHTQENPHNRLSIESKVAELKKRFEAGQIHDWYDTQTELLDVATKPAFKRRTNSKGTGRKT